VRGQSLAFFALLLPALFAFCALGLDAGNLYVERREMQAAADLAALAGARGLPNVGTAVAKAQAIATANGYSSTVTVTTPYGGDTMKIEVSITRPVNTLFLPILGVTQVPVSARSVARNTTTTGNPYAVFAGANTCSGTPSANLTWTSNGGTVNGLVHSNSGIAVSGNSNRWTGGTTYKCNAAFVDSAANNLYSPAVTRVATDQPWPISYTWSDYCSSPTYYHPSGAWDLSLNGPWWSGGTSASRALMPGVYCADGSGASITLTVNDVTATNVTLVSRGNIRINGNNFFISANELGTAFAAFGTGTQAIKVEARTGATGVFYAPSGQVDFTANTSGFYTGGIVASTVKVSGNTFTISGSVGGATSTTSLQLLE
jgi:Flp pilus assembly protein TadG